MVLECVFYVYDYLIFNIYQNVLTKATALTPILSLYTSFSRSISSCQKILQSPLAEKFLTKQTSIIELKQLREWVKQNIWSENKLVIVA